MLAITMEGLVKTSVIAIAFAAAGILLSGCMPDFYAPGAALADKHEGPMMLATATSESIAAMFPKGTTKAQVVQVLGAPHTSTNSSDGSSTHLFSHNFTSYERKFVQVQTLVVEYDSGGAVQKTTLSNSNSSW